MRGMEGIGLGLSAQIGSPPYIQGCATGGITDGLIELETIGHIQLERGGGYVQLETPYTTGAVSTDNGTTWTYSQQSPSWVTALRAPSGALPLVVSDFKNNRYWVQWPSGSGLSALWYEDTNWGSFDPAVDIVPGTGLTNAMATVSGSVAPAINAPVVSLLLPSCTIMMEGVVGEQSGANISNSNAVEINMFEDPSNVTLCDAALNTAGAPVPATTDYYWGTFPDNLSNSANLPPGEKLACTFGPLEAICSVAGAANVSVANGQGSASNGSVALNIWGPPDGGAQPNICTLIAFYAPQPDADLLSLSTP